MNREEEIEMLTEVRRRFEELDSMIDNLSNRVIELESKLELTEKE